MILLILFPFAFLLLPGRHKWNLTGQEAMAHCCAAPVLLIVPWLRQLMSAFVCSKKNVFPFLCPDEIWSLCGGFVGRASGALLEAPLHLEHLVLLRSGLGQSRTWGLIFIMCVV